MGISIPHQQLLVWGNHLQEERQEEVRGMAAAGRRQGVSLHMSAPYPGLRKPKLPDLTDLSQANCVDI